MRAERAACRMLLRLCRAADREPARLVGLLGQPPRRYDMRQARVLQMRSSGSPFEEDTIAAASGGSTEFAYIEPRPPCAMVTRVATRAARQHYRRAVLLGLPVVPELTRLARRFDAAGSFAEEVGALVVPSSDALSNGGGITAEKPTARPRLRSCSPRTSSEAAVGDILVTHPLSCLVASIFDQAVLLLHESSRDGIGGLVLNKPMSITLGEMLDRWPNTQDKQWLEGIDLGTILAGQLFKGGPIIGSLKDSLRWLHLHGPVRGASEVAPSVWFGGDLSEIASRCDGDLSGIRFFLGYSGWATRQLQIELECGVWIRVQAEAELAEEVANADALYPLREVCFNVEERGKAWRSTLRHTGQCVLAAFPRSSGADQRARGHLERFSQVEPASDEVHDSIAIGQVAARAGEVGARANTGRRASGSRRGRKNR